MLQLAGIGALKRESCASRAFFRHLAALLAMMLLLLGWQAAARAKLAVDSRRLAELLAPLGEISRTALFCTVKTAQTNQLIEHFARRAILSRHYESTDLLRLGLPANETQWQRLAVALAEWA